MLVLLVLVGPLVAVWLYAATALLLSMRAPTSPSDRASPPAITGYVADFRDLGPPRDGIVSAAKAAGTWADNNDWAILALPTPRPPGIWNPQVGPPDDVFCPLPLDPTDGSSVVTFLMGGEQDLPS